MDSPTPWWNVVLTYSLIVYTLLFVVGTAENLLFVILTLTNKNLRSMFNSLFTCVALFQCLSFAGIPVFITSTVVHMSKHLCVSLFAHSSFGTLTLTASLLILTIDRLIATCTPNHYKTLKIHEHYYILFLVAFPVIYAAWVLVCAYLTIDDDESQHQFCLLAEGLGGAYILFEMSSYGLTVIVLPLLLFVNCQMKCLETDNRSSSNYLLFRALVIVTFISTIGVFSSHFLHFLVDSDALESSEMILLVKMSAGVVMYGAQCCSVPVFCFYVKDYRDAFWELCGVRQTSQTSVPPSRMRTAVVASGRTGMMAMRNGMV